MADPKPYKRGYSFENYQADVPDQPLPGVNLDIELDKIAGASDELTKRVNAGIDVSINNDALEAVAAEVPKMVFVADNMDTVREVADLGPNLELATDLFLGAFANDPDTTGDGNPLAIGATYYNTLIGESRVWAGPSAGWIPVAKVSTGGVLQGGTTADGSTTEFHVGDYVSIMLARNGLVLEPGTDYTMTSPTVTVPAAQAGDRLAWFAILKGTTTDAAAFVRQTVLTTAGRTTYDTNTAGDPLNLSQTNHVLFGGSPFGMLTYGVDYTVADGGLVLDFAPAAGELFHIFSMPRFTNSEAQAILQDFKETIYTPRLDDWDTPQAAIDWIAENGGEMIIPSGVHTLTEPLSLAKLGPTGRRAVLRGEGQSSVLQFNGVAGDAIYAGSSAVPGSGLGWELRDFRIRGTSNAAMTGIFLQNANSARIKRVWFERMQDAIRMQDTYGARISECHATQLGRDFLRLASRTFHLIMRDNGAFGIGGYFVNCPATVGSLINIRLEGNDVEVCGGLIKSALPIYGLSYVSNYMEQSSGQVFDFDAEVTGEISGGNTLQMSGAQVIDNFRGRFTNNHLLDINFTWGATSFPSGVGDNFNGANATVQPARGKQPAINAPYVPHGDNFAPPIYRRDESGRVFLNGNARRDLDQAAPTYPFTLFRLEPGYRPAATQTFATVGATTGTAKIRIAVTGDVIVEAAPAADLGLGGISFVAGA